MPPLSAPDILRIWEFGRGRPPVQRALGILVAAEGSDPSAVLDLPIGTRDDRLLAVREATFGPELRAWAVCATCGGRMEMVFDVADIRRNPFTAVPLPGLGGAWHVRPLTSADLEAAAGCGDPDRARRLLALRALDTGAETGAEPPELDEATLAGIASALERADPGAVRSIEATCPACGAAHECEFDVADYIWTEIDARAIALLRDVHILASGYGWTEAEVLALSPARRQAYRELLQ